MYLDVNKAYSSFDSNLAKNEKNDCFVRALAVATGSAYETAHEKAKSSFGRPDKKGTENLMITTQMLKAEDEGLKIGDIKYSVKVLGKSRTHNTYKLYGESIQRKKTVKSFIKDNPKGNFILTVSKHALAIIDGKLVDNKGEEFRPTRKVDGAYKINKPVSKNVQLKLF